MSKHTIHITGNAKNVKGKAILETENVGQYCIRGIKCWKEGWQNRRIRVIGDLIKRGSGQPQVISRAVVHLVDHT